MLEDNDLEDRNRFGIVSVIHKFSNKLKTWKIYYVVAQTKDLKDVLDTEVETVLDTNIIIRIVVYVLRFSQQWS